MKTNDKKLEMRLKMEEELRHNAKVKFYDETRPTYCESCDACPYVVYGEYGERRCYRDMYDQCSDQQYREE